MKFRAESYILKNGEKLNIRMAIASDAAGIREHILSVLNDSKFLITRPEEFAMTVEDERRWIEKYDSLENDILLLALCNGSIAGLLNFNSNYRKRICHTGIFGMTVIKKFRGLGVGNALLEALIKWAAQNKTLVKISLEVFEDNIPAINLYKKHGFAEEGKKIKEVRMDNGKYSDIILMYKIVK